VAGRKPSKGLTGRYAPSEPQQYFRRVPGKKRTYYNVATGERVTEHFVVRVYRPSRTPEETEERLARSKRWSVSARRDQQTIWRAYQAKERFYGREPSRDDFNFWYEQLQDLRIERLRLGAIADRKQWDAFNDASSDFAQVAEELGLREPTAHYPIDTSPRFKFRLPWSY
jgi:hypothetical protein